MLEGLIEFVETFVIWAALTLVKTGVVATLVEIAVAVVAFGVVVTAGGLVWRGYEKVRREFSKGDAVKERR